MGLEPDDTIIITEDEQGERLDKILANRFSGTFSRTYFQYLIEEGAVLLNGQIIKKRAKPKKGDEIRIEFILTPEIELEPEEIPLDILFEDDHLIAINKPRGMVVHPAPGNTTKTFVNALLYHCKHLPRDGADLRPGIVHRLDKETSGVLVAAKDAETHRRLIELFAERKVEKEYLAICVGVPKEGKVETLIGRHPKDRKKMAVLEDKGKHAISHIQVLAQHNPFSLVKVKIETGRTHQIRVHLKHLGCPVVGDGTYGSQQTNNKVGVEQQLLHAHTLAFTHPISGEELSLTAPIPHDMETFITKHRLKN